MTGKNKTPREQTPEEKKFLSRTKAAKDTSAANTGRGIDNPTNPLKTSVTTHGTEGTKDDVNG